jgi:hypothetical protein
MGHRTQYLSDHFSLAGKVQGNHHQLQTNDVAERFNRTLTEQALGGQVFRYVHGVRETVRALVDVCNNEWRVGKNH